MHILITGAAGMVGRKLTGQLVSDGGLNGRAIDKFTLVDVVAPKSPAGFTGKVDAYAFDVSREDAGRKLVDFSLCDADVTKVNIFKLVDESDSTVTWSRALAGITGLDNGRDGIERKIILELATSIVQPFGVISANDRAKRMTSSALDPRYQCLLEAGDALRSFDPDAHVRVRDRLVFMGYPAELVDRDLNYVRRFLDAAREAADGHGLPYELISPVEPRRDSAQAAVDRALVGRPEGRVGIVVPNSPALQPILNALQMRGAVPGRDLSLVALCTDVVAEQAEPPLTNLSIEPRDVSLRAMETLFWLLEPTLAGAPPAVDLVPPRLTRRESVLPSPSSRRKR